MRLIASVGKERVLINNSQPCSFPIRRYFQSQGLFLLLLKFYHSPLLGLFTVPTRIVFVVAPINALLNWLLGPYSFSPHLLFSLQMYSMGSKTYPTRIHWRTNSHCDIFQSHFNHVHHLWYRVYPKDCVVSAIPSHVYELGRFGPAWVEWCW